MKPYLARVKRNGKFVSLGTYATAEDAALAYSRSPEGRARSAEPEELSMTSQEAVQQAEKEGITLQRSDNVTGFKYVSTKDERRGYEKPYLAYTSTRAGKNHLLGCCASAEGAALLHARYPEGRARTPAAPAPTPAPARAPAPTGKEDEEDEEERKRRTAEKKEKKEKKRARTAKAAKKARKARKADREATKAAGAAEAAEAAEAAVAAQATLAAKRKAKKAAKRARAEETERQEPAPKKTKEEEALPSPMTRFSELDLQEHGDFLQVVLAAKKAGAKITITLYG